MSLDRAQRQYDNASPPEDRPACEGICGGEADPYPTQHADESDRDYCDDCRAGAEACQRWDDGESVHDDLLLYGEHLLRHIGYEPTKRAVVKTAEYTPLPPAVAEAHAAFIAAAEAGGFHSVCVDLFTYSAVQGAVKSPPNGPDYTLWRDEGLNVFGFKR